MGIYDKQSAGALVGADSYPGRGIIIGKTADGTKAAVAYFIMGRSENSRNRIFVEQPEGEVEIHPYDPSKVEDPSLIIYSPIKVHGDNLIVTNGDQTSTIYDFLTGGKSFEDALSIREFEPDAPNLTPRISGMLTFYHQDFTYKMSILKSADAQGTACNRYTYAYHALPGLGHFIHTYAENGNPLPTFQGEPKRVDIPNDIQSFADEIWNSLDSENKISLYVRFVDLATNAVENVMYNKNA